jgi:hypothetical protein
MPLLDYVGRPGFNPFLSPRTKDVFLSPPWLKRNAFAKLPTLPSSQANKTKQELCRVVHVALDSLQQACDNPQGLLIF